MTLSNDPIVIVSAVRTPMGGFQGELKKPDRAATGRRSYSCCRRTRRCFA